MNKLILSRLLRSNGSSFQSLGAATEQALFAYVLSLDFGTARIRLSSGNCLINHAQVTDGAGERLKVAKEVGQKGLVIGKKIEVFHYLIARAHIPWSAPSLESYQLHMHYSMADAALVAANSMTHVLEKFVAKILRLSQDKKWPTYM